MAYMYKDDKGSNKATIDALNKTKDDIAKGVEIEQELSSVWEKIKIDAIIGCPKDTTSLASTIRVVKTSIGSLSSGISTQKSITIFDRTIVAGDLLVINPKTKGPVNYASWVHDGYMKDGKAYNGRPFLTNALAAHDAELTSAVDRALGKIINKNTEHGSVV